MQDPTMPACFAKEYLDSRPAESQSQLGIPGGGGELGMSTINFASPTVEPPTSLAMTSR